MLNIYVRAQSWLASRLGSASRTDRGSVTVEQVIITGMVATAAVIAGSALWALVNSGISRWSLW